jgi:hypothetical protein
MAALNRGIRLSLAWQGWPDTRMEKAEMTSSSVGPLCAILGEE